MNTVFKMVFSKRIKCIAFYIELLRIPSMKKKSPAAFKLLWNSSSPLKMYFSRSWVPALVVSPAVVKVSNISLTCIHIGWNSPVF